MIITYMLLMIIFSVKAILNNSLNFENKDHIIYFPATIKEPSTDQIDEL